MRLQGREDTGAPATSKREFLHLGSETTAYFAKDGLGSISAVFDTNGKLLERLWSEPFERRIGSDGKALQDFVSSANVALGFTGQRHDDDLDLIDYQGRVYDPVQKRFLTPDPLVPSPLHSKSFNRYAFVGNNPLRYVDPSGFQQLAADGQSQDSGVPLGATCDLPDCCGMTGAIPGMGTHPPEQAFQPAAGSSDGHGAALPVVKVSDGRSVGSETLLPHSWHIHHEPVDIPPPEVRIEGEMRGPEDVTDLTVRYGGQAAEGLSTGTTIAWGVLTLGTGYDAGKGITAGGRQVIDGLVDGDAQEIINGAVTLGETALEITNAPQAIADALTADGRDTPQGTPIKGLVPNPPGEQLPYR